MESPESSTSIGTPEIKRSTNVLAMRGTAFVPTDLVQCIQIIATDSLGSERVIDRWEQADNRAFTHSIRDGVVLL